MPPFDNSDPVLPPDAAPAPAETKVDLPPPPDGAVAMSSLPPPPPGATPFDVKTSEPSTADTKPRDAGVFGGLTAGGLRALRETGQSAEAVTGGKPQPLPEDNIVQAQPLEWSDVLHPMTLAGKTAYQFGHSAPSFAAGLGAGAAASLPFGGPEDPAAWLPMVVGGALGAGAGDMAQSIGPHFAAALKDNPGDPDKAWDHALKQSLVSGAISAAGWGAFSIAPPPFKTAFKHLMFQAFGVQPAVSAAGTAAENLVEGRPVGEGVARAAVQSIPGTLVPAVGMHGARLAGQYLRPGETPAATTPDARPPGQSPYEMPPDTWAPPPGGGPYHLPTGTWFPPEPGEQFGPPRPPEYGPGVPSELQPPLPEGTYLPGATPRPAQELPQAPAAPAPTAPTPQPPEEVAAQTERDKLVAKSQPVPEPQPGEPPAPAAPPGPTAAEELAKAQQAAEADAQRPATGGAKPEAAEPQVTQPVTGEGQAPEQGKPPVPVTAEGGVPPQRQTRISATGKPLTEIGQNHLGQTLWEDERGVRSLVDNSIVSTEPVQMRPTRAGVEFATDRTNNPEFQIAQPHPASGKAVEYQSPAAPPPPTATPQTGGAPWIDMPATDGRVSPQRSTFGNVNLDTWSDPNGLWHWTASSRESGAPLTGGVADDAEGARQAATNAVLRPSLPPHSPPRLADVPPGATPETPANSDITTTTPTAAAPEPPAVPVQQTKHAKTGADLFVVQLPRRFERPEYDAIAKQATGLGGYFSSYNKNGAIPGFQFKTPEAAQEFAGHVGRAIAPTPYGTPQDPNVVALGQKFAQAFAAAQEFKTINDVRRFAATLLGGEVPPGARKALDEAVEFGATLHARDIVEQGTRMGAAPPVIFNELVKHYQRMPLLNERTADSLRRQAFSTPAPIAYLASRLAGVTIPEPENHLSRRTVYEPTAGNGMLLIEATPSMTVANEIDPTRRSVLEAQGFTATGLDAAQTAPSDKFDVILANPPFGKVEGVPGGLSVRFQTPDYITQEVDHAIAFRSLGAMKDDGSAVLIIGGKKGMGAHAADQVKAAYNSQESRAFFKSLYDRYRVTDHFTIAGDLYSRSGAAWPIDVIRIEGRGKSDLSLPGVTPPRIYETFDQLRGMVDAHGSLGAAEQQPGDHGGRGPGGEPEPTGIFAVDAGTRGKNDQGGGGRSPGADQPGNAGPGLPGRPPGELAAGADGGPGPGTGGAGERIPEGDVGIPAVGEGGQPVRPGSADSAPGNVVEPGGPEGAGRPKLSDDELGDLLDNLIGGTEPTTTPALQEPRADYGRAPETGYRPGMRPELNWEPEAAEPTSPRAPRQAPGREPIEPQGPTEAGAAPEGLAGLSTLFEDRPFEVGFTREYVPGVDPEHYAKAMPFFLKSVLDVGAKPGDDIRATAAKIVGALRDDHGFTPDRLAAMKPYLLQFIKDVQDGTVRLGDEGQAASRREENKEVETKFQVRYTPASEAGAVGTLVPINMQTAITRALNDLQSRVGNIDDFVANKLGFSKADVTGTAEGPGLFSAEQVDAIAMMIDNLDRGAGFIIGDQTGVGKGRTVAAMIRYAQKQGKIPMFVTASPGLYADMYRDLRDIGVEDFNAFVTNGNLTGKDRIPLGINEFLSSLPPARQRQAFDTILKTGNLPPGFDALFTTYSQMQTPQSIRLPVLNRIAPNSLIIMDESHEAGGTETRNINKATGMPIGGRQAVARELLAQAEGVIYSSATYAKNPHVMSLYSRTDMPLAVDGDVRALTDLIKTGGVPFQQVIANMLTEGGQYIRRERSFDGVDFRTNVVAADQQTAERSSELMRHIFDFDERMGAARDAYDEHLQQTGGTVGPDGSIGVPGAESTVFSSLMHNLIGQSLLALKSHQAVDEAVAAHQRGEKPIIALSNTMGALLDNQISAMGLRHGDEVKGLDFNRAFDQYLKRTRTVLIKDPFDSAKDQQHYITDAELREIGHGYMVNEYNQAEKTIRNTDLKSMPGSPLDYMIDGMRAAGMRVGEITGRSDVVEDGILRKRDAGAAERKRTMNAFNAGELDALLINRAGSTGFSLHASGSYADQKPRHMVLLQADPNIDTFMQILGRIHRTGQVTLPRYSLLISDLPAEKRPAANLMRKLGSLNANTSANKESAISMENVADVMNKYGDQVVGSLLSDEPTIANRIGLRPNDEGMWPDGIAAKATGRLAILPIQVQEDFWNRVEQNYGDLINTLNRTGQNSLEARTLDLDANTVEAKAVTDDKGVDSPFGRSAILEKMDVRRLGMPMTVDEIRAQVTKTLGEDDFSKVSPSSIREFTGKLTEDLAGKTADYLEKTQADFREAQDEMLALRAHPDLNETPESPRLKKALEKAENRVHRLNDQILQINDQAVIIRQIVDAHPPGSPVTVTVGTGDSAEDFHGIVTGIVPTGKTSNPSALSGWIAHVAIADASRDLSIPLSQLVGKRTGPGTYEAGQASMVGADSKEVLRAFEEGRSQTRETRHIVTGNLVSGFNAFTGRGQFVMFRRSDGSIEPGLMLPRKMDPDRELAARPAPLSPAQAFDFVDRVNGAEGRSGIVHSADGIFKMQRMPNGQYRLEAQTRGGAQYFKPKAVNDLLGQDQFIQRKGDKNWHAQTDRASAEKVLNWYADNLDTRFEARADKEHARALTHPPDTASEEPPQGKPLNSVPKPPVDRLADYQQFAANTRGGESPHVTARNWATQSSDEHMAIWDPGTGQIVAATTRYLVDRVSMPAAALDRAATDPDAGLIAHHNHPFGTATSPGDVKMLALPGLSRIVAHGNNGAYAEAGLTDATRAWFNRIGLDEAIDKMAELADLASASVKTRLEALIENGRLTADQGDKLYSDLVSRALDTAGVIDYVSSHRPANYINDAFAKYLIREAALAVRAKIPVENFPLRSPEETTQILHRSTRTVRPDQGIAGLPGPRGGVAEGGPERSVGDAGDQGRSGLTGASEETRGIGDAEEARPFAPTPPGAPDREEVARDLGGVMQTTKPSLVDRVKSYFTGLNENREVEFKQGVLDDLAALELAERGQNTGKLLPANQSPTDLARHTRNLAGMMSYVLGTRGHDGSWTGGALRYVPAEGDVEGGTFEPIPGSKPYGQIVEPIAKAGLQDQVAAWMIANRSERLMGEDRERNVTPEFIEKYKDSDQPYTQPDGTNPFHQFRDEWQAFNKAHLDMMEQVGAINPARRAMWDKADYLPYYRALGNDEVGGPNSSARRLANIRSPIKQLKGGESKIADVWDNMVRNTGAMVDFAMKTETQNRVRDLLSGTEALTPLSKDARLELTSPEGRARLEAMGLDPDHMSETAKEEAKALFGMLRSRDPGTVMFTVDGKPQYFKVEDPYLLRSINAIGPRSADGVMKLLTGARMLLTHSVMLDPAFMMAHFIRMSVHGWASTGYDITPGYSAVKGAIDAFRNSPSMQAIMAGGAGGAAGEFKYGKLPREVRQMMQTPDFKQTLLNQPHKVVSFMERIGRASDMAVRVAAYDDAISKGLGKAEALRRAQDILDFTRRGDNGAINFLTSTVPFLNARLQGLSRTYRGARENPKSFLIRGGLLVAASLALWAYNQNDPRYQALEDWDKQYAWHFFTPWGHFRLPKPFEIGAIFASIPEMMADYSNSGSDKELRDAFLSNLQNQWKFDPVPALLRPALNVYANRDSFTGRPIVNDAEAKLSPANRYGPYTSSTMVAVGQALGVSPDQAEALVRGYGGALGGYALAATDALVNAGATAERPTMRLDQYPIVQRFVREDPERSNRWITEFYQMKTEVDQLHNDFEDMRKNPGKRTDLGEFARDNASKLGLYQATQTMAQNLSRLRRASAQIMGNPTMDADTKRQQLDALTAAQNRIAEGIRPLLRRAEGLPMQ